ncbi:hypothetical protein AVEN_31830-1 [Araneus ventricosus]|uniref:Uncharacterized protein n=1 Tax=Araneus ventricosus TaxID=182803 RepID=A0A4Y2TLW9_ARAVE|nr:hypothetical protein AVEN_31830-1 [Araneus ventricosus]
MRTTPELTPLIQASTPRDDVWPPTYDLKSNRPTYTADLQSSRVSNLEPSCPLSRHLVTKPPWPSPPRKKRSFSSYSFIEYLCEKMS